MLDLADLRAQVGDLRARLERLEASRPSARAAGDDERLIRAMACDYVFTAAEMLAHGAVDLELAGALRAAQITSPQQLGKWLRRAMGREIAGLVVARHRRWVVECECE